MKNSIMKTTFAIVASVAAFANAANATVIATQDTITIDEKIGPQTLQAFNQLFNDNIKEVKLKSEGGIVQYGKQIAKAINDRGDVTTTAIGQCNSMCGAIWLSGQTHKKDPNGHVGFHLAYIADSGVLKDILQFEGIRGIEKMGKTLALATFTQDFQFINNKANFGIYMDGMQKNGLMPTNMWQPSDTTLQQLEGPYIQ